MCECCGGDCKLCIGASSDNLIPEYIPSFKEVAKQMRINADTIMAEITQHVDREIERIKKCQVDATNVESIH